MSETPYYVAFSHLSGIGPLKFAKLRELFGTVEQAYNAERGVIKELLGDNLTDKFFAFKTQFDPQRKTQEIVKKGIQIITQEMAAYPNSLKNIPDPPICLYVKGSIKVFQNYLFSVVGTRKPTPYGSEIAKKFSHELAIAGFTIVSGMALGIDTIAHQAALNVEGKTIAILGCGVDIIYPASNRPLYLQIIKQGGCIVSEFPPGHLVKPGLFIARNRIISGLSRGVLVIEGAADSGALITARYAAVQGKEVFAPPGPLGSTMSAAPNILLKQGAKFVTETSDILEEFNLKLVPREEKRIEEELNEPERKIFSVLKMGPHFVEDLRTVIDMPVPRILEIISMLEIKGIILKNNDGKYETR